MNVGMLFHYYLENVAAFSKKKTKTKTKQKQLTNTLTPYLLATGCCVSTLTFVNVTFSGRESCVESCS
jgi:hypothetical protein